MKITPAQRKALEWIRDNEPVRWFPCDKTGPSLSFAKRLVKIGLVRQVRPVGPVGMCEFSLTEKGDDIFGAAPARKEQA